MLACAIAAEQLIQLFHTHKSAIAKQESKDKKNAYLDSIEDSLDVLDLNDEDGLREAYGQTFDMIDQDRSDFVLHRYHILGLWGYSFC